LGNHVLVIGGGNAAVDTARSALRKSRSEVTMLYRRSLEEMPAAREEVRDALREGIKIEFLIAPKKILVSGDRITGLECIRTELGEADSYGRKRPVPVEGSEFAMKASTIISAVGQQPDYEAVASGLVSSGKALAIDRETLQTGVDGVFAAGDFVTGPSSVVEAMAGGKKAARAVDRYLESKEK